MIKSVWNLTYICLMFYVEVFRLLCLHYYYYFYYWTASVV
jgi:hypothetical protein